MTATQSHAKRELEILAKTTPDAVILPFTNEILALCEAFGKSGQSGGSAPFTSGAIVQALSKLLNFEAIGALTGEDWEWVDVSSMNDGVPMWQNNRDSRVFKYGDGRASFVDAIVFDGDIGGGFTSNGSVTHNGEIISSSQYIRGFPFRPKTFYVKVRDYRWKDKEEKIADPDGDWWTHELMHEDQLKEVFSYYDKK